MYFYQLYYHFSSVLVYCIKQLYFQTSVFFFQRGWFLLPCQDAGHEPRAGQADQGEAETVFRDCERAHHQRPAVLSHRGRAAVRPVWRRTESLWAAELKGTAVTSYKRLCWSQSKHFFFSLYSAMFFGIPLTSCFWEDHFQLCASYELQWLVERGI